MVWGRDYIHAAVAVVYTVPVRRVIQRVFQSFSSSATIASYAVISHVCSGWNFRLSLRETSTTPQAIKKAS